MAAVQAKRMGKTVAIVCPDRHLGGLSSGGLGWTDSGSKEVIGGLAREFYHRIYLEYDSPDAWKWQEKSEYGNKGQGAPAIDGEDRTMWIFEPHVAEQVFEDLVTAKTASRRPMVVSNRSLLSQEKPIPERTTTIPKPVTRDVGKS